jgi:nitrite reductase/ring-hydroxylating ferredoxin subunit
MDNRVKRSSTLTDLFASLHNSNIQNIDIHVLAKKICSQSANRLLKFNFDSDGWFEIRKIQQNRCSLKINLRQIRIMQPPNNISINRGPENPMASPQTWHKIAEPNELDSKQDKRLHVRVNGRYISVICYQDRLHCLDSVCFHAGGPLALGEIEEIAECGATLVCPYHYYHVSLRDGEKWYQAAQQGEDGKLHAGQWKSVGQRQRVHQVEQRSDGIYVKLNLDGALASDEYACKAECGARVRSGSLRLNTDRDGSRSPARSSSPLRGTPPASPRGLSYMEGEDIWPEDLVADSRGSPSGRRRNGSGVLPPPPDMNIDK